MCCACEGVGLVDERLEDETVDVEAQFERKVEEGGAGSFEKCGIDWRKVEVLHLFE